MHIYSAGPFANVVCALLAMALINLALAPAYEGLTVPVGIEVTGTTPGLPAAQAGVPNGTLVRGLNGAAVTDYASFNGALRRVGPNETVVLETDRDRFEVTTAAHPEDPSRGYLGVVIDPGGRREVREEWAGAAGDAVRWAIGASTRVLYYVFMLHISIGVINLLPVFPLDGGRMLIDLVGEWGSPSAAAAAKLLSSALLFVLILNIIGPHTVSLAARLLG
jgi:membrane-associated protease RseP (regulator of RpoE activity)